MVDQDTTGEPLIKNSERKKMTDLEELVPGSEQQCECSIRCCKANVQRNKTLYTILALWFFIVGLLLVFSGSVIDPILDWVEEQNVKTEDPVHILVAIFAAIPVFSPHPLIIVSVWLAIICFYWEGWGLILGGIGLVVGLFWIFFYTRYLCSRDCQKNCVNRCFPESKAQFKMFERAVEDKPITMGVILQFSPFQSQVILLIVMAILESPDLLQFFIGTWLGVMISCAPLMFMAMFASNLSDALNPDEGDAGTFIAAMIAILLLVVASVYIGLYAKKMLQFYAEEELVNQVETHLAETEEDGFTFDKMQRDTVREKLRMMGSLSITSELPEDVLVEFEQEYARSGKYGSVELNLDTTPGIDGKFSIANKVRRVSRPESLERSSTQIL